MSERNKLYRSQSEWKIAGICGGIAERYGIKPWPVRAGFIVLGLLNGLGVLIYLIMWLVIPDETYEWDDVEGAYYPTEETPRPTIVDRIMQAADRLGESIQTVFQNGLDRRAVGGLILVVIGIAALAFTLVNHQTGGSMARSMHHDFDFPWWLIWVIPWWMFWGKKRKRGRSHSHNPSQTYQRQPLQGYRPIHPQPQEEQDNHIRTTSGRRI
jgi:phage shock protein PspC (stress-responsive transcriptional regulator)